MLSIHVWMNEEKKEWKKESIYSQKEDRRYEAQLVLPPQNKVSLVAKGIEHCECPV